MDKKEKRNEQVKQDKLKRNVEMAEGQNPKTASAIYKKGDKYFCAECHSELPLHTDCPSCHAHIDWDRALAERRPF